MEFWNLFQFIVSILEGIIFLSHRFILQPINTIRILCISGPILIISRNFVRLALLPLSIVFFILFKTSIQDLILDLDIVLFGSIVKVFIQYLITMIFAGFCIGTVLGIMLGVLNNVLRIPDKYVYISSHIIEHMNLFQSFNIPTSKSNINLTSVSSDSPSREFSPDIWMYVKKNRGLKAEQREGYHAGNLTPVSVQENSFGESYNTDIWDDSNTQLDTIRTDIPDVGSFTEFSSFSRRPADLTGPNFRRKNK